MLIPTLVVGFHELEEQFNCFIQNGNKNRIGASFIINEEGNVIKAYFGKYVVDQMPVSEIKKM